MHNILFAIASIYSFDILGEMIFWMFLSGGIVGHMTAIYYTERARYE